MPGLQNVAGGGPATRQFRGNLFRVLQKKDFDAGAVLVADYLKIDSELTQIFQSISFADPTVKGTQVNGNFNGALVQTVTPSATGISLTVNHGMGRVPVGWISVGPTVSTTGVTAGTVTWQQVQPPDVNNLYLKVVRPEDTNVLTALIIW
jgi:hypothetical protein